MATFPLPDSNGYCGLRANCCGLTLQPSLPRTTIVKETREPWRFKATCGHVKQSAKALARRLRAGFFVIVPRRSDEADIRR